MTVSGNAGLPGTRKIAKVFRSKPTLEGAGVHLRRAFGYSQVPAFDPFLMLDDYRSDTPAHYHNGKFLSIRLVPYKLSPDWTIVP